MKYGVTLPIVGYAWCEVEADNREEAVEKALMTPWDEYEIPEMYTCRSVVSGNVCHHPFSEADVEEV